MFRCLALLAFTATAQAGTCEAVCDFGQYGRYADMCMAERDGLKELRVQDRDENALKDRLITQLKAKIVLLEMKKPKRKKRR